MKTGDLVGNGSAGGWGEWAHGAIPALVITVGSGERDGEVELYQPGRARNREWRPEQMIVSLPEERKAELVTRLVGLLEKWQPWTDSQMGPLAQVRQAARIAVGKEA